MDFGPWQQPCFRPDKTAGLQSHLMEASMSIVIPWQRASDIWKEAGTPQTIASLLRKASFGLLECATVRFFARDLARELAPMRPLVDLQLRLASIEDVGLLVRE